jgi:hypothetical protein
MTRTLRFFASVTALSPPLPEVPVAAGAAAEGGVVL